MFRIYLSFRSAQCPVLFIPRLILGEHDTLIKTQREEILAAERQGKAHVAARLPRLHQEQLSQLESRQAQEVSDSHMRIQQLLDQKVGHHHYVLLM